MTAKRGTYPRNLIISSRYKGIFVLALVLGLVAWSGYQTITHFMAEVHCNTVANSTLNRDENPALEEIESAIFWDADNAEYWHKLAQTLTDIRSAEEEELPTDPERSEKQIHIVNALEHAVRLNPFETPYRLTLAWEYSHLWQDPDHRQEWLKAADTAMERAAYFAGEKAPGLHLSIGNYWIMRSKATIPSDPDWKTAWENASWHYRKAQSLQRKHDLKQDIQTFVWRFYPDEEMIRDLLQS